MRRDFELGTKGPAILCDAREIGTFEADADDLLLARPYADAALAARLFYFEPDDGYPGIIRVIVDEPAPAELVARASLTRSEVALDLPTGELVVCDARVLSAHERAPVEERQRLTLVKGSYLLDAYVLAMTDDELAEGPSPAPSAARTEGLAILGVVWFLFATLVYAILAYEGLARDALGIYLVGGALPMVATIIVHRVSGGAARIRDAAAAFEATRADTPSLLVVLARSSMGTERRGGGIAG